MKGCSQVSKLRVCASVKIKSFYFVEWFHMQTSQKRDGFSFLKGRWALNTVLTNKGLSRLLNVSQKG